MDGIGCLCRTVHFSQHSYIADQLIQILPMTKWRRHTAGNVVVLLGVLCLGAVYAGCALIWVIHRFFARSHIKVGSNGPATGPWHSSSSTVALKASGTTAAHQSGSPGCQGTLAASHRVPTLRSCRQGLEDFLLPSSSPAPKHDELKQGMEVHKSTSERLACCGVSALVATADATAVVSSTPRSC